MKSILVLGAGQSATYMIRYLLEQARERDWFILVGDRDKELANRTVDNHPCGTAVELDIHDGSLRRSLIERAEVVVNFMPQRLQPVIAWDCLQHSRHMVSVSYRDREMKDMEADAQRHGVLLLTEVGLDPGIDLMSAMSVIHDVHRRGGVVEAFESYGSGVPAPEVTSNPLRYCITWNPRNVVMAGEGGAQYLEDGKVKITPWHHLFRHSWPREVPGIGTMEAYPNRDSLAYRDVFGIPEARTLIRGTLRYPGWSETWQQIVHLGLPNETISIPDLASRSFSEMVEMFLPHSVSGSKVPQRVANYLQISPTGRIMDNLRWLGLFSEEPCGIEGSTTADALIALLKRQLPLPDDGRDMVILLDEIVARYPDEGNRRERTTSTFIHYGEPGGRTAMSKTVGLPAGIAVKLLLEGRLPLTGCHIPIHPAIYQPILSELESEGFEFHDETEEIT